MKTSYLIVGVALVLILIFATKTATTANKTNSNARQSNDIIGPLANLANSIIARTPLSTSTSSSGLTQLPPPTPDWGSTGIDRNTGGVILAPGETYGPPAPTDDNSYAAS